MATTAAEKPGTEAKASAPAKKATEKEQPAAPAPQQESSGQPLEDLTPEQAKEQAAVEALDLPVVRWVIGKPPEYGGNSGQFSVYEQTALGVIAQKRFFALVAKNIKNAVKEGGDETLREIMALAGTTNAKQALANIVASEGVESFLKLAIILVEYSPEFMLDCFVLWLNVDRAERMWARDVMEQKWDPENELWGLKKGDDIKMTRIFFAQNKDDIRDFFSEIATMLPERSEETEEVSEPQS